MLRAPPLAVTGQRTQLAQLEREPPRIVGVDREVQGGQQEPVDKAVAGEIAALVKMEDLSTGDTLSKDGKAEAMSLRVAGDRFLVCVQYPVSASAVQNGAGAVFQ